MAQTMNNLGLLYEDEHNYKAAQAIYREAIQMKKRV